MTYTIKQLQEAFNLLPDTVKDYLIGDNITEKLDDSIDDFAIPEEKEEGFRKIVLALEVGLAKPDEFINFAKQELEFSDGLAENLFIQISENILSQEYDIFDEATKNEKFNEEPKELPAGSKPLGDIKKFVGVPEYGVQRPASSYTSVLPRSDINQNKIKDTPTADSFIQKLNALNGIQPKDQETKVPTSTTTSISTPSPATPQFDPTSVPHKASAPMNTSNIGSEVNKILSESGSAELAKLVSPVNIPRQEIKIKTESSAESTPQKNTQSKVEINSVTSTTAAPISYPTGNDPYREPPTP